MDGNGVFIELIIFVLTIYGVLVMRKKVSSFIGNGDLLGTTNPLPKKWWTTTTSRGAASFFLRDEGFPDYTWSCYKCSTKWISTTRHILACSIILCHFFPEGLPYINIFCAFQKHFGVTAMTMWMITVLAVLFINIVYIYTIFSFLETLKHCINMCVGFFCSIV